MSEQVPEEFYNPNYHWKYREGTSYMRIRPRVRLDAAPLRELMQRKRSKFDTMHEMADYIGIPERQANRIYYGESDRTHIDIADRICMGFNMSLRDLYGE